MSLDILVTGGGFKNKGAEAMVCTVLQRAHERHPDARVWAAVGPSVRQAAVRAGLLPLWRDGLRKLNSRFVRAAGKAGLTRAASALGFWGSGLKAILDFDMVLDVAGYYFGDRWGPRPTGFAKMLADLGIPIVYMPQAWGPFTRPEVIETASRILSSASYAFARDDESRKWMERLPSFDPERVSVAPDIAFGFRGESLGKGRSMLGRLGTLAWGRLVGIVPNTRVYALTGRGGLDNPYVEGLAAAARHFAERENCSVVVMPHEIGTKRKSILRDDRSVCSVICERTGLPGQVVPWLTMATAGEFKAMIGCMDLVVSSRYHSLIAALSQRVPVVAVGWSHKYRHLLSAVGMADSVVSHDGLEADALVDLCDRAWRDREGTRALLAESVAPMEKAASDAVEKAFGVAGLG